MHDEWINILPGDSRDHSMTKMLNQYLVENAPLARYYTLFKKDILFNILVRDVAILTNHKS